LAACADFPDIPTQRTLPNANYPTLAPLDALLADESEALSQDEVETDVAARLARLNRRANDLSGPLFDDETKSTLESTLSSAN